MARTKLIGRKHQPPPTDSSLEEVPVVPREVEVIDLTGLPSDEEEPATQMQPVYPSRNFLGHNKRRGINEDRASSQSSDAASDDGDEAAKPITKKKAGANGGATLHLGQKRGAADDGGKPTKKPHSEKRPTTAPRLENRATHAPAPPQPSRTNANPRPQSNNDPDHAAAVEFRTRLLRLAVPGNLPDGTTFQEEVEALTLEAAREHSRGQGLSDEQAVAVFKERFGRRLGIVQNSDNLGDAHLHARVAVGDAAPNQHQQLQAEMERVALELARLLTQELDLTDRQRLEVFNLSLWGDRDISLQQRRSAPANAHPNVHHVSRTRVPRQVPAVAEEEEPEPYHTSFGGNSDQERDQRISRWLSQVQDGDGEEESTAPRRYLGLDGAKDEDEQIGSPPGGSRGNPSRLVDRYANIEGARPDREARRRPQVSSISNQHTTQNVQQGVSVPGVQPLARATNEHYRAAARTSAETAGVADREQDEALMQPFESNSMGQGDGYVEDTEGNQRTMAEEEEALASGGQSGYESGDDSQQSGDQEEQEPNERGVASQNDSSPSSSTPNVPPVRLVPGGGYPNLDRAGRTTRQSIVAADTQRRTQRGMSAPGQGYVFIPLAEQHAAQLLWHYQQYGDPSSGEEQESEEGEDRVFCNQAQAYVAVSRAEQQHAQMLYQYEIDGDSGSEEEDGGDGEEEDASEDYGGSDKENEEPSEEDMASGDVVGGAQPGGDDGESGSEEVVSGTRGPAEEDDVF